MQLYVERQQTRKSGKPFNIPFKVISLLSPFLINADKTELMTINEDINHQYFTHLLHARVALHSRRSATVIILDLMLLIKAIRISLQCLQSTASHLSDIVILRWLYTLSPWKPDKSLNIQNLPHECFLHNSKEG